MTVLLQERGTRVDKNVEHTPTFGESGLLCHHD
jgi:hypothetical protein